MRSIQHRQGSRRSALALAAACLILAANAPVPAQSVLEIDHYRRVISSDPGNMQAHLHYQDLLLQAGRRADLQREYRVRLDADPGSALLLYLCGRLITDQSEALPYLQKAVAADGDLYEARLDLARSNYYGGNYDTAIHHFKVAKALKPSSAFVRHLLGLAYYHKGYVHQAIEEYKQAIRLNENYGDAYLNLGLAYYYTDKIDDAIDVLQEALELDTAGPNRHHIYRNLGMAYARAGRLGEAEGAYREALEIDSTYAEVYVNLGNLAFNRGDYGAAIDAYSSAIENESEEATGLNFKLGVAHFNRGTFEGSIRHLERAVEADSSQTDAYYYLGWAYHNDGQDDRAREAFETYVRKEKRLARRSNVYTAKEMVKDLWRQRLRTF